MVAEVVEEACPLVSALVMDKFHRQNGRRESTVSRLKAKPMELFILYAMTFFL